MELRFDSKSVEAICLDEKVMNRKRGDIAKKLRKRMQALRAANRLGDLIIQDPLGKWHSLSGNRKGQWAAWVSTNHRLIVRPEADGTQAVVDVTEVTVLEPGLDYH